MGNSSSVSKLPSDDSTVLKVLKAGAGAALAGLGALNIFSSSGSCENKAASESVINIEGISGFDGVNNKRTITSDAYIKRSKGSCDNKAALEINIKERSERDGAFSNRTITSDDYIKRSKGSCDNKAALEINIKERSERDGAFSKRTITSHDYIKRSNGSCDNKAASEIYIKERSERDGAISKRTITSDDYIKRPKGDAHLNPPSRKIKIMSYNVWLHEDVKVTERMNAIGRLIRKNTPEVIFFQEVTPNIYRIFQSFRWWKLYNCSHSVDEATTGNFCLLLSKLPVKYFVNKCLENGREICIALLDAGKNKSFYAATSHLKSSVGPNPRNCSTQRVAQAREALRCLRRRHNVVFGGDMNWDESMDGPFPLKRGWVDAWSTLRPEEDGWTFDTVANQMLHGKRKRQKRFDRFVCKLLNFKTTNIKIIGNQPIPGLWHRCKSMMNPVYPSDHFGLLLTISTV